MTDKLPPLKDINPSAAYVQHLDVNAWALQDATRLVGEVVKPALAVATDMMWPTILAAAIRLKDVPPVVFNGWTLKSTGSESPYRECLVLQPRDGTGGYLFNIQRSIRKGYDAQGKSTGLLPPEMCTEVESISCIAFSAKKTNPDAYSLARGTLPVLSRVETEQYDGRVFKCRPSLTMRWGGEAALGIVELGEIGAAIFAMQTLSEGLAAMGLERRIEERLRSLEDAAYNHFETEERALLPAIGVGAVVRDGGCVGESVETFVETFAWRSAAIDVSTRMRELLAIADKLEANGHVSRRTEYGEDDDVAHVIRNGDDGRSLFIKTQNHQFRIDIGPLDANGNPQQVAVGVPKKRDGEIPDYEERGFIGQFDLVGSEDGRVEYETTMFGSVDSRHLIAFNDFAFTIDSLHSELDYDCGDDEDMDEPEAP
ncbi:hypothetical protein D3C71_175060 [compost metagenome]